MKNRDYVGEQLRQTMNLAYEEDVRSVTRTWRVRAVFICVLLFAGFAAIFVCVRQSSCPISVVLKDVSPVEMVDGAGKKMWQVIVVLTNSEPLQFESSSLTVETKEKGGAWISPDGQLSGVWSGRTTGIIFVVPTGTTDYRIRFAYQREMLRWRFWAKLGNRGRTFVIKYAPALYAQLWPRNTRTTFNQPPNWKHVTTESSFPQKVRSEPL